MTKFLTKGTYLFWLRVEESRVHHGGEGMDSGSTRLLRKQIPAGAQLYFSFLNLLFSLEPPTHGMALPTFEAGLPSSVTPLWKPPHSQPQVCLLGYSKSSQADNRLVIMRKSTSLSSRLLSFANCMCYCFYGALGRPSFTVIVGSLPLGS